jgi:hypothetical protein
MIAKMFKKIALDCSLFAAFFRVSFIFILLQEKYH